MHHYTDSVAIAFIVIANGLLGYYQEIRAQKSLSKLENYLVTNAKVIRSGELNEIPATDLVAGDIVILESGIKVPADLRITESINLKIDEASLTGESLLANKTSSKLSPSLGIADRKNIAYGGTFITTGRGRGVVIATGAETEFGKITASLSEATPPPSQLQVEIETLSKQLIFVILLTLSFVVIIGVFRKLPLVSMFLTAVNLAVAAIPEGLPAVMTITLAIGVRAMAQRKAIVKDLAAVETLGAISLIATDKTGTLTKDEMIVEKIYLHPEEFTVDGEGYSPEGKIYKNNDNININQYEDLAELLKMATLCNDASLVQQKGSWKIIGDPTEGALIVAAAKANLPKPELDEVAPRIDEIPFHSARRYMATLHQEGKKQFISIKGAAEEIINMCSMYREKQNHTLKENDIEHIKKKTHELTSQGYRVIAIAKKEVENLEKIKDANLNNSVFLGLCAMKDAPRRESHMAIHHAHNAGIRVAMITGDHALTAQSIASNLDIYNEESSGHSFSAVTGSDLDRLKSSHLQKITQYCNIYARVSPLQKLQLVKQFQDQDYVVAVTGDGINDSAALKQADVGIAMGKKGTDVSREAASVVLANDNFATIVAAIEEGRAIYNNVKRVLLYLLSTNVGEVFVILLALIIGFKSTDGHFLLPVEPIQILWINLITDGFATLPLALEPKHKDLMKHPPRNKKSSLLDKTMQLRIIIVSLTMAIGTLLLFSHELKTSGYEEARSVAFVTMILFQLFNMFNCRALNQSIFSIPLFNNAYVAISFLGGLILTTTAVYFPPLQKVFYTTDLNLWQWIEIMLVSSTVIIAVELEKYLGHTIKNKGVKYGIPIENS